MSELVDPLGQLSIERNERSPAVILTLRGDIDLVTAPQMKTAVAEALKAAPPLLVLDLTAVDFLASTGLTALLTIVREIPAGSTLRIVASGRATMRPIELTGLEKSLPLYRTLDEALSEA
ncbi:MAG TPA: STAS domain-containing protein [Amycolatopsis sp.]|jgi:anti-sigma B factor antagonist|nr:STAS domain-containing protein [Amycolatopsis sp.]